MGCGASCQAVDSAAVAPQATSQQRDSVPFKLRVVYRAPDNAPPFRPGLFCVDDSNTLDDIYKRAEELFLSQLTHGASKWELFSLEVQGQTIYNRDSGGNAANALAQRNAADVLGNAGGGNVLTACVRAVNAPPYVHVSLRDNPYGPCAIDVPLREPPLSSPGSTVADLVSVAVQMLRSRYATVEAQGTTRALLADTELQDHVLLCLEEAISAVVSPGDTVLLEGFTCISGDVQRPSKAAPGVSSLGQQLAEGSACRDAFRRPNLLPPLWPLSRHSRHDSSAPTSPSRPAVLEPSDSRFGVSKLQPVPYALLPRLTPPETRAHVPAGTAQGDVLVQQSRRRLPPLATTAPTAAGSTSRPVSASAHALCGSVASIKQVQRLSPPVTSSNEGSSGCVPDEAPAASRSKVSPPEADTVVVPSPLVSVHAGATELAHAVTSTHVEPSARAASAASSALRSKSVDGNSGGLPGEPLPLSAPASGCPGELDEKTSAGMPVSSTGNLQEQHSATAVAPKADLADSVVPSLTTGSEDSCPLPEELRPTPAALLELVIAAIASCSQAQGEAWPPALQPERVEGQGLAQRLAQLLECAGSLVGETCKGSAMQLMKVLIAHEGSLDGSSNLNLWPPVESAVSAVTSLVPSWSRTLAALREVGAPASTLRPRDLMHMVITVGRHSSELPRTALGRALLQHLAWPAGRPLQELLRPVTITLATSQACMTSVLAVLPQSVDHGLPSPIDAPARQSLQEYVDHFAAKDWAQFKIDDLPTAVVCDVLPVLKDVVRGGLVSVEAVASWLGMTGVELLVAAKAAWNGSALATTWHSRAFGAQHRGLPAALQGYQSPLYRTDDTEGPHQESSGDAAAGEAAASTPSDTKPRRWCFPPVHRLQRGDLDAKQTYVRLNGLQLLLEQLAADLALAQSEPSAPAQSQSRAAAAPLSRRAVRLRAIKTALDRVLHAHLALVSIPSKALCVIRTTAAGSVNAVHRFLRESVGSQTLPPTAFTLTHEAGGSDVLILQLATAKQLGRWDAHRTLFTDGTLVIIGPPAAAQPKPNCAAPLQPSASDADSVVDYVDCLASMAEHACDGDNAAPATYALATLAKLASADVDSATSLEGELRPTLTGWSAILLHPALFTQTFNLVQSLATRIAGSPSGADEPTHNGAFNDRGCCNLLLHELDQQLLAASTRQELFQLLVHCVRNAAAPALEFLLQRGTLARLRQPEGGSSRGVGGSALCPLDESYSDDDPEGDYYDGAGSMSESPDSGNGPADTAEPTAESIGSCDGISATKDASTADRAVPEEHQSGALQWVEAAESALLVSCILSQSHDCLRMLLRAGACPNSRTLGWWRLGAISAAAACGLRPGERAAGAAANHSNRLMEHGLLAHAGLGDSSSTRGCWLPPIEVDDSKPRSPLRNMYHAATQVRPLHIAADMGDERAVAMLLDAGASPTALCRGFAPKRDEAGTRSVPNNADGIEVTTSSNRVEELPELLTPADIAELRGLDALALRLRGFKDGGAVTRCARLGPGSVLLCETVRVLRLAAAGLRAADLRELCHALQASPARSTLGCLDVRYNPLTQPVGDGAAVDDCCGLEALADMLRSNFCPQLRELHLLAPAWQSAEVLASAEAESLVAALLDSRCGVMQVDSVVLSRDEASGSVKRVGTAVQSFPSFCGFRLVTLSSSFEAVNHCGGGSTERGSAAGGASEAETAEEEVAHVAFQHSSEVLAARLNGNNALVTSWRPDDWHLACESAHGAFGAKLAASALSAATAANVVVPLEPTTGSRWLKGLSCRLGANAALQHLSVILLQPQPRRITLDAAALPPLGGLIPSDGKDTAATDSVATTVQLCCDFISNLANALHASGSGGQPSLQTFNLIIEGPFNAEGRQAVLAVLSKLWTALQAMPWLLTVNGRSFESAEGSPSPLASWLPAQVFESELQASVDDKPAGSVLVIISSVRTEAATASAVTLPPLAATAAHLLLSNLRTTAGRWSHLVGMSLVPGVKLDDASVEAHRAPAVKLDVHGLELGWGIEAAVLHHAQQDSWDPTYLSVEFHFGADAAIPLIGSTEHDGSPGACEAEDNGSVSGQSDSALSAASTSLVTSAARALDSLAIALLRHSPRLSTLNLLFAPSLPPQLLLSIQGFVLRLQSAHPSLTCINGVQRCAQPVLQLSPLPPSPEAFPVLLQLSGGAGVEMAARRTSAMALRASPSTELDVTSAGDALSQLLLLGWRMPGVYARQLRCLTLDLHGVMQPLLGAAPLPALEELHVRGIGYGDQFHHHGLLCLARQLPSLRKLRQLSVQLLDAVVARIEACRHREARKRRYGEDARYGSDEENTMLAGICVLAAAAHAHTCLQAVNGIALEPYRAATGAGASSQNLITMTGVEGALEVALRVGLWLSLPASVASRIKEVKVTQPDMPREWPRPTVIAAVVAQVTQSADETSHILGSSSAKYGDWHAFALRPLLKRELTRLERLELRNMGVNSTAAALGELAQLLPSFGRLQVLHIQYQSSGKDFCSRAFGNCARLAQSCVKHPTLIAANDIGLSATGSGVGDGDNAVTVAVRTGNELTACLQVLAMLKRLSAPGSTPARFELSSETTGEAAASPENLSGLLLQAAAAEAASASRRLPSGLSALQHSLRCEHLAVSFCGPVTLSRSPDGGLVFEELTGLVIKLNMEPSSSSFKIGVSQALEALSALLDPCLGIALYAQEVYVVCWADKHFGYSSRGQCRPDWQPQGVGPGTVQETLWADDDQEQQLKRRLEAYLEEESITPSASMLEGILTNLMRNPALRKLRLTTPLLELFDHLFQSTNPDLESLLDRMAAAAAATARIIPAANGSNGNSSSSLHGLPVSLLRSNCVVGLRMDGQLDPKRDACSFTLTCAKQGQSGAGDTGSTHTDAEDMVVQVSDGRLGMFTALALLPASAFASVHAGAGVPACPVLRRIAWLVSQQSAAAAQPARGIADQAMRLRELSIGSAVEVGSAQYRQLLSILQAQCWPNSTRLQVLSVELTGGSNGQLEEFAVALLRCPSLIKAACTHHKQWESWDKKFAFEPAGVDEPLACSLLRDALPPVEELRKHAAWQGCKLQPLLGAPPTGASAGTVEALTVDSDGNVTLGVRSPGGNDPEEVALQWSPVSQFLALGLLRACPSHIWIHASHPGHLDTAFLFHRLHDLGPAALKTLVLKGELMTAQDLQRAVSLLAAMRRPSGGSGALEVLGLTLGKPKSEQRSQWLPLCRQLVLELMSGCLALTSLRLTFSDAYTAALRSVLASAQVDKAGDLDAHEEAFLTGLFATAQSAAAGRKTFHGLPTTLFSEGHVTRAEVDGDTIRLFTEGADGVATAATEYKSTPLGAVVLLALLQRPLAELYMSLDGGAVPLHWLLWRLRQLSDTESVQGGETRKPRSLCRLRLFAWSQTDASARQLTALLHETPSIEALELVSRNNYVKWRSCKDLTVAILQSPSLVKLTLPVSWWKYERAAELDDFSKFAAPFYDAGTRKLTLSAVSRELSVPEELLTKAPQEVLQYMRELRLGQAFSFRCKLMLVGPGDAGKTTLVKRLLHDRFEPNVGGTDGLGVYEWALPLGRTAGGGGDSTDASIGRDKMTFSLWDFGGQDVYYSTHAFFMAARAVYLVLFRSRDDSGAERMCEYLARIQALAPGAPMVLVGTHAGEATEQGGGVYKPRPPSLVPLRNEFRSLHPEVMYVSSLNGYGIMQLKEVVLQLALQQPGVGERLPASFMRLRDEVQRVQRTFLKGAEPVVSLPVFQLLAAGAGVHEPSQLALFSSLLSDFGDILHFQHVPGMEDAVVLRPQWVADVMAHVITMSSTKLALMDNGRVSRAALLRLLSSVSPTHAEGLVSLLESFSMLHMIDRDTALVPPMLPDATSARGPLLFHEEAGASPERGSWRWWSAHYVYSYLPDALMCRALCRVFALRDVEVLEVWRFGAVLRRRGHLAIISQGAARSRIGRNAVSVTVCGPRPENLGPLVSAKLRDLLAEAFAGVKLVDIRYDCPHCVAGQHDEPWQCSVKVLQRRAAKGNKAGAQITCEACDNEVNLAATALLDGQAEPWWPALEPGPETEPYGPAVVAEAPTTPPRPAAPERDLQQLLMGRMMEMLASLSQQLGGVQARLDGAASSLDSKLTGLQGLMGAQAEGQEDLVRRVTAVSRMVAGLDAKPLPALHVVLPMPSSERRWWDVRGLVKARFRLHLLCEQPGAPHLTDHGGYEIERPAEWLRRYAPAVRLLTHSAGLLLGAGVKALTGGGSDMGLGRLGEMVDTHVLDEPLQAFEQLNELLSRLEQEEKATKGASKPPPPTDSQSAAVWQAQHQMDFKNSQEARREMEALILKKDPNGNYGSLQKVKTLAGDVLWLCKCHAQEHVRNKTCWITE